MRTHQDHRPLFHLATAFLFLAMLTQAGRSADDRSESVLVLSPVYCIVMTNMAAPESLCVIPPASPGRTPEPTSILFHAVVTNPAPTGLVALYLDEKTGKLLRLPPESRENSAEPLFFALPPEGEADTAKIAGYWYVQGVRGDGSKAYLGWELATWEGQLRGRFDPHSDYRVADIVGGSFRSNRIELEVKYINDRYSITGQWSAGRLVGRFRNFDGSEEGSWDAHQARVSLPARRTAPLYEWRRDGVEAPRYRLHDSGLGPDWQRGARPHCRVWIE